MGKDDTFKGYINCVLESIPMVPARYLQKLSAPGNRLLSTCQNGRAALLFFQVYALDIIKKKPSKLFAICFAASRTSIG